MQTNAATVSELEPAGDDLGPLAWVLEELKKSLDGATKAMRRFVRDAELARGSEMASLDASQLRIARQQLHQAVGALEMVGFSAPARVMRAMEALAQRFVQRPELCSDDAANKMERASFALAEFLEGVLKGKTSTPVALFAQYRDVVELVEGERVHPADLWPFDWHWVDLQPPQGPALSYEPAVRSQLDQSVLRLVKSGDKDAALKLRELSLGLARSQTLQEPRAFWMLAAAFFEANGLGLCPADVYAKRMGSRVLQQYATLAKGDPSLSDRLALDLLFFCAHAGPHTDTQAPVLDAVRQAWRVPALQTVNYEVPHFGKFDPALLVQMRKRVATATETWSALAGGDTNRIKLVTEQFNVVNESMLKMQPENGDLARALAKAVEITVRSGEPPTTPIAMEVATAVLYLEAAFDDLDPNDTQMTQRSLRLAKRLEQVSAGGTSEPLEGWMEDLYRRVSDRQTMGSVVDELRTNLAEIEKSLDQFFRNTADKVPLQEVPSQLSQMRGVFSVLGLDQASTAMLRMRDSVEKLLVDAVAPGSSATFEKLGSSLGAVGFLIDMLSYQRTMAKKVFVWDEETSEFKPLMGRAKAAVAVPAQVIPAPVPSTAVETAAIAIAAEPVISPLATPAASPVDSQVSVPTPAAPVVPPAVAPPVASAPEPLDDDEAEIRDIFLEEAAEVVQTGQEAIKALAVDPSNLADQTTLRRAFHTLKGSSRMVGLNEFGEAAWSMEQLLNAWLADQKPASEALVTLSGTAMGAFGQWVGHIAARTDAPWSAAGFRASADALRLENRVLPLVFPGSVGIAAAPPVAMPETLPTPSPAPIEQRQDAPPSVLPPEEAPPTVLLDQSGEEELPDFQATAIFDVPAEKSPATKTSEHGTSQWGDFDFNPVATPQADFAPTGFTDPDGNISAPAPLDRSAVEVQSAPAHLPEPAPVAASAPAIEIPSQFVDSTPPESVPVPEETVKVIGSLRINIPLYNVFLNEADEWSRRLQVEISEWALELHRPVPESAIALAHSLSGSSATVGFTALSDVARSLESALQHVQLHRQGDAVQAQTFANAAEDIRRLLHQFAAGFLKEPDPQILGALNAIVETEFSTGSPSILGDLDFVDTPHEDQAQSAVEPVEAIAPVVETASVATAAAAGLAVVATAALPAAKLLVTQAAPAATSHDDDIDLEDALDADLFPIFDEEAQELMPQLGGALRQWSSRPDNMGARSEALRVLHTLKGSARLAGALRLGEMTHRMESQIEQLGSEAVTGAQIEPLLARFDDIQANFEALKSRPEEAFLRPEGDALALAPIPADPGAAASPAAPATARKLPPSASALAPIRQTANQSVRVRSQLLDRLVNQAGEVMISRSRLQVRLDQLRASMGDLTGNLDRMRHHLRDIEVQAESQMQSRMALAKETAQQFDPLEFDQFTRLQELTRMMAESVNDVATVQRNLQRTVEGTEDDLIAQGRQARELQRDLLRTRMVEFESISERLYGVVRQASKDAGKQVKLDINGGSLDVDRGVLERMAPAFEHLLRNSVAHGIETAEDRVRTGKAATGTITIDLHHQGNELSVDFSDDGAGLNLPRIREKAMSSGVAPDANSLSDADAANLIFLPGFSTASAVTEIAGRGIGMDVVRSEMNALGGRIETSSDAGKGTRFKLVLPLTTAVTQVVMLRMGDLVIGVPANVIEIVRRVPSADLDRAYTSGTFQHAGEEVPFFWAGSLLQASAFSSEMQGKHLPVAVFRSAGQRVAAHVDEILGNQEVVVKNLGPQLSRLPGLTGMSVLASGAVVLIYNPVALVQVYGEQAKAMRRSMGPGAAGASGDASATPAMPSMMAGVTLVPLIMVVDDSITVRRVTQRLLKREGYRVVLAADGLQALERLQDERPSVVLSDIEMPRMDGFDLARNIRADAALKGLPIIMITSRIAEKHREHARELGVDHYLGKPYSEDELLRLVKQYCDSEIAA